MERHAFEFRPVPVIPGKRLREPCGFYSSLRSRSIGESGMTPSKEQVTDFFSALQDAICSAMEKLDGGAIFSKDKWSREGGGGGLTRAIVNGKVLEKGCVNFSAVNGKLPAMLVKELKLSAADAHEFFATGVSIVMHPHNP